jgi:hypothetical protein
MSWICSAQPSPRSYAVTHVILAQRSRWLTGQQAENKTIAYEEFGNAVSKISIERMDVAEKMIRRSLNIGFEWSILVEAQQVIEELEIMQGIFLQQLTVMKDLEKIIKTMRWATKSADPEADEDPDDDLVNPNQRRALDRVGALIVDMEQRRDELKSMEILQTKTRTQVRASKQHPTA